MNSPLNENIYLPNIAIIDRVVDEIDEVKTFYWHFENPTHHKAFRDFRPGQFAQISIFGVGEFAASLPPSPREKETFFTIRRVGSCTAALHQLDVNDKFAVRGPYGNGFPMEHYYGKNLVFVAGGIGLIPLRSCIVYALENRDKYASIQIFYGSKTSTELMYVPKLREWENSAGIECHLTVDRGSEDWSGNVGVVGSLLKNPDVMVPVDNSIAFVCGPPIMFRFVIKDLLALGFQEANIVSTLERYMKCGVGKCGHCCIGVAYVCTDGPVFTYEQIKKLGEDI
jgi:NAD(P)H-flavin reductase